MQVSPSFFLTLPKAELGIFCQTINVMQNHETVKGRSLDINCDKPSYTGYSILDTILNCCLYAFKVQIDQTSVSKNEIIWIAQAPHP